MALLKNFAELKKIDVERPFHTICSFLQHFPHYETSFSVFQGKLHFFAQKDKVERIRQKLIREGAASNGLYYRSIFLYNPFTKIFQNFKTYFLTTFNTFLMKTAWFWNLYFKLLLIKLFVPILALSRFELNGYSPVSVLSREASTSL